jgi:hypothetical protein
MWMFRRAIYRMFLSTCHSCRICILYMLMSRRDNVSDVSIKMSFMPDLHSLYVMSRRDNISVDKFIKNVLSAVGTIYQLHNKSLINIQLMKCATPLKFNSSTSIRLTKNPNKCKLIWIFCYCYLNFIVQYSPLFSHVSPLL